MEEELVTGAEASESQGIADDRFFFMFSFNFHTHILVLINDRCASELEWE